MRIARELYNTQNHNTRLAKGQRAPVSVSDASRELLIALGLVDGPGTVRGLGPLGASPTRRKCSAHPVLSNCPDDGTDGGETPGDRAHEQRSRATAHKSTAVNRSDSEFLPSDQFTEYASRALNTEGPLVHCVATGDDGEGHQVKLFCMPPYERDSGAPQMGKPVLVGFMSRTGASICRCSVAIEAHAFGGSEGTQKGSCLHSGLFSHPQSSVVLEDMACTIPSCMRTHDGSYAAVVSRRGPWGHSELKTMHVFVHAAATAGCGSDHDGIVTLTPGYATCSVCHDGRKQEAGCTKRVFCPHSDCIQEVIDGAVLTSERGSGEAVYYADIFRMRELLSSKPGASSTENTTFNTSKGIYEHPSLSSNNEKANEAALGITPVNVELDLSQISPRCCQLGGEEHMAWSDADAPIALVEPITQTGTPLHGTHGCVYCSDTSPDGWISLELDGSGREHQYSLAFFLSHSRKVQVNTRQCSGAHPECQVKYTGRSDGFHRHSYDTMMRHEVILLYWHVTKTMHGPGAQSFGGMLHEIYRLAGGRKEGLNYNRTLFMEADTLRSCVFGYLARQRRVMNKRCPTCPDGCPHITFDAKKLRHPVRLSPGGLSPDQTTKSSPRSDCGVRGRDDRIFFPGEASKLLRQAVHALARDVLGKGSRIKSEHAFSHADAEYVTKNSSGMLQLAVKVLLDHWKCTHAATLAAGGVGEGVKSTRDHDGDGSESGGSHVEESDEDGSDTETYRAVRTQQRRGPKDGESPASRAGVQVGDEITQVQGHCVSSEPFSGVVRRLTGLPCDVPIALRMRRHGLGEYSATLVKLYDGGLCMQVEAAGGGCGARVQALYLKPTGLHRELAYQLYWMTNPQCEVTQWITTRSLPVLKVFLTDYRSSQKVYASTSERLRSDGLRISISRLIDEARVRVLGFPGKYTLHPAALALLDGALERAEEVTASLSRIPRREALSSISSESRPVYDPSTGVAYHFTKKGERLFWFPDFKTKSEPKCKCRKPDWMKSSPNAGLSEGVLTVMCLRSGVVLGNTMLTGHEGCKDGTAALYSFHPDLSKLGSVVCDTPCMHSTYVNTRCGADFCWVKWTGDRFHIKAHTCRGVYCPDEFIDYARVNTSLIEQWHSVMDCLVRTVKGSTLCHAMLLLQTLQDDRYRDVCAKLKGPIFTWD